MRGVAYFAALLLLALSAGVAPPIAPVARAMPWFVRDLLMPGTGALLLGVLRVDGRTFHVAAGALVRHLLTPRALDGLARGLPRQTRWRPEEIVVLPDGSDARLRRLRYAGPGAVLVSVEHELSGVAGKSSCGPSWRPRRRTVILRERGCGRPLDHGQVVVLEPGTRLLVSASSRGGGSR